MGMGAGAEAISTPGNGPAGAPATPPSTPGAAPAPTPPAGGATPPATWYGNVAPETKTLLDAKKFDSIDTMAKSYIGLEKLARADPSTIVTLPKEGEDMAPVWNRLGRPDKVEGYKLEGELAPMAKDPLVTALLPEWHKAGLTQAQMAALVKTGTAAAEKLRAEADAQFASNAERALSEVKMEWGAGYERNIQAAKATALKLGLTGEEATAIERAMGTKAFLTKFATAGQGLLEATHVDGQQRAASGQLTPQQAVEELAALGRDKEFQNKLRAGDKDAKQRIKDLTAARAGMQTAEMQARLASGQGLERVIPAAR